jgi:SAM-dependent methyltransferase
MTAAASPPADSAIDPVRAEAFEGRFFEALNHGGLLLMSALGHRTGLFDAMASGASGTSEEIARAAGLHERYVREWLAAMASAGVVELQGTDRYALPPEHALVLARGGDANLAVYAQMFSTLGSVEDDLVRCFREGGGVAYERYHRFHEVMAEDSGQTVLGALHEHILPLVPGLAERLARGIRALDLGCGRGLALLELAERYPASRCMGYDLSEEAIDFARGEAHRRGLGNARFQVRDLRDFDRSAEPEAFDLVTTFDAVHDQADPAALLRGIARTLAPEGVYLMQDVRASSHVHENLGHPLATFLYAVSCTHCMPVSLAQGGAGLGTMWGRQRAREMLREAGFTRIELHELEHDVQNDFYVLRR